MRSKMTAGRPHAPFATSPEAVADVMVAGLGTTETVVWAPPALPSVFAVLAPLPTALWKRLLG